MSSKPSYSWSKKTLHFCFDSILPLGLLHGLIFLGMAILTLFMFVIAICQVLDITTGCAMLVCMLAALALMLLAVVLSGLLGVGG